MASKQIVNMINDHIMIEMIMRISDKTHLMVLCKLY